MRDYLQEAKDIIAGKTMMLPEKAHLEAMNNVIFKLIEEINKVLTLLEENIFLMRS